MIKLNDMRRLYLDYFVKNGHREVKSDSLVPTNDPTLLFTVAGMVQFKDMLLGREVRDYKRAVSAQKCIRTNDLDDVGYDGRHLSFFEMLGNWSFGDYFKEESIYWSWDFLTNVLGLEKDRLWMTVYPTDMESRGLWKKIAGVGDDRIIDIEDNFWAAGPVGPRGFDTEIFYDQGAHIAGGLPGTPEEDGDRYVEIWNNVFMDMERLDDGTEVPLKAKNVDTGMGIERISAVIQGVASNYEVDLFRSLIYDIASVLGVKPGGDNNVSFQVIADHLRAATMLVADGVTPSNEGRGYVLRRIIRRAGRHLHLLGARKPAMFEMVASMRENMGGAYPEIAERHDFIKNTIEAEEAGFSATLEVGLKLLEEETGRVSGGILPGSAAFKLYDTYGFPIDMTRDILRGRGMALDEAGFELEMARQKEQSRGAAAFKGTVGTAKVWYDLKDAHGETEFAGYDTLETNAKLLQVVAENGNTWLVFDRTPFYAEMGGQAADRGIITIESRKFEVADVQKFNGVIAHKISAEEPPKAGETAVLSVDANVRARTISNHSSAHLLQYALRQVVGDTVVQKGSMLGPDGMHFDFANQKAVMPEQLLEIERIVNAMIDESALISTSEMSVDDAKKAGAIALFGEKYGEVVRVVDMGGKSIELCGGTHCSSTGEVKFFHILSERSIAAGIRRIEAVAGDAAIEYAASLGVPRGAALEMAKAVREALMAARKREEAEAAAAFEAKKAEEAAVAANELATVRAGLVRDGKFASFVGKIGAKHLKQIARDVAGEADVVVLVAVAEEKASIVVYSPNGLVDACSVVKAAIGSGGGAAEMAQGGFAASEAVSVVAKIRAIIG